MDGFIAPLRAWLQGVCHQRGDTDRQSGLMERVSHEMRTSLTGIVGYAEYLETTSAEPMMNFTANIIRESGQELARSSNAYFELAYLQRGQGRLSCSRFLLSDVTRDVLDKHESNSTRRDVKLLMGCSKLANLQYMNSDIDRVRQVLDALIFDALQWTEKHGCICVDLSVSNSAKCLTWSLEASACKGGPVLLDLHEKFWNLDNYRFRLQQGPGVELALAKALIQFLGGKAHYCVNTGSPSQLVVTFPFNDRNLLQAKR